MQIRYVHQNIKPLLPALGDLRIVSELRFKSDPTIEEEKPPEVKFHIARCIELSEHHVFYEFIGEDFCEAVPYELVENYGYLSMDEAIKHTIDSYMRSAIDSKISPVSSMFAVGKEISEYFVKLQNLVILSKQTLKEAEKAKRVYQQALNKRK